MESHALSALSPLDGRYAEKTQALRSVMSEHALMRERVRVEITWLKCLAAAPDITEVPKLSKQANLLLDRLITEFNLQDALHIKTIERSTNHDVKAVEYFLKEKFAVHDELKALSEFIHFACTSEDINNLAYSCMVKNALNTVLLPELDKLLQTLRARATQHAAVAMLAHTHGQPATPTTIGKEFANIAARLQRQINSLHKSVLLGKCNGAVGNFNAHSIAYSEVDWPTLSMQFVTSLGLQNNPYTTQIEPHDSLCELLQNLQRCNSILIDCCRDMWGYISLGYFTQKRKDNEVGSSTMPHKINPIDFENAEGNFGLANALIEFFSRQLPTSRWQRDLVDSTVLRNLAVIFGHVLLGLQALSVGLNKLEVNTATLTAELDQHWEILTEAVQTVMRRYGYENPYEQLKTLSRGQHLTQTQLQQFIQTLPLPAEAKTRLLQLTPQLYLGLATQLAQQI